MSTLEKKNWGVLEDRQDVHPPICRNLKGRGCYTGVGERVVSTGWSTRGRTQGSIAVCDEGKKFRIHQPKEEKSEN